MAHNIYEDRMFSNGKAWHDVGVRVDQEQTAESAITLAKLDYEIKKVPLQTIDGISAEGFYGTLNTANNKVLGIVSDRYKIVQNKDAFGFFDEVVKTKEAIYHSAGALGNGERIWILAKLPTNMLIFKDDVVEKYLLLTNCHDGKGSLLMYFTPIRVVCQNTLIASFKDAGEGIAIRHMGDMKSKTEEARKALGLALDFYTEFEVNAKAMLNVKLTQDRAFEYFDKVLNIKKDDEISTQSTNIRDTVRSLYRNGKGNSVDGVKDTLWAGYNAVTEFTDHYKTTRGDKVNSILFGSGAQLKKRAYSEAMAVMA
jgi:phage/plasmid-like protein (TIGR03299 family)